LQIDKAINFDTLVTKNGHCITTIKKLYIINVSHYIILRTTWPSIS